VLLRQIFTLIGLVYIEVRNETGIFKDELLELVFFVQMLAYSLDEKV